eukprot:1161195-Pelagomonas_calceolata.AAC.11
MAGGAPRGFLSTTHRSNHTSPVRPYSARGVSAIPLEFAPVPGGTLPPPVGTLSLRGDHVNVGTFDTRSNELMHLLSCTRDDLSSTRAALEQTRLRAEAAEARQGNRD